MKKFKTRNTIILLTLMFVLLTSNMTVATGSVQTPNSVDKETVITEALNLSSAIETFNNEVNNIIEESKKAELERLNAEKAAAEAAKKKTTAPSSTKKTNTSSTSSASKTKDCIFDGVLKIPSVGINVNVYSWFQGGVDAQVITDRTNSACGMPYFGVYVIADHKHQGFNAMKKSVPGSTTATFAGKKYVCLDNFQGRFENKYGLVNNAGVQIQNLDGDIFMYTCNTWPSVTITSWKLA